MLNLVMLLELSIGWNVRKRQIRDFKQKSVHDYKHIILSPKIELKKNRCNIKHKAHSIRPRFHKNL